MQNLPILPDLSIQVHVLQDALRPLHEGGELRLGDDAVLVGVRLLQDLLELLHNLGSEPLTSEYW